MVIVARNPARPLAGREGMGAISIMLILMSSASALVRTKTPPRCAAAAMFLLRDPGHVARPDVPARAPHQAIVPFFVVSTSSSPPALKRNASMFLVRKLRACGSITLRP